MTIPVAVQTDLFNQSLILLLFSEILLFIINRKPNIHSKLIESGHLSYLRYLQPYFKDTAGEAASQAPLYSAKHALPKHLPPVHGFLDAVLQSLFNSLHPIVLSLVLSALCPPFNDKFRIVYLSSEYLKIVDFFL